MTMEGLEGVLKHRSHTPMAMTMTLTLPMFPVHAHNN